MENQVKASAPKISLKECTIIKDPLSSSERESKTFTRLGQSLGGYIPESGHIFLNYTYESDSIVSILFALDHITIFPTR